MPSVEDDRINASSSRQSTSPSFEEVWQEVDSLTAVDVSEASDTTSLTAYVRYARFLDGKFTQTFLVPASRPVPDNAKWVSPAVYFLTDQEEIRLHEHERPKDIQAACEEDGRVAYAVLAESDALERGYDFSRVTEWLVTFAEDRLGLSRDEYSLQYSGNRSIHLHTAKFVPGEEGREWLKQQAEDFTRDTEAELDTGIYQAKGQFRLTGAEHEETNLYKVNITSLLDDDHPVSRDEVVPRSTSLPEEKKWPFLDVQSVDNTSIYYVVGDDDRGPLPDEYRSRVLDTYLNDTDEGERVDTSNSTRAVTSAFSPYAKVGDSNGRSVCLLEQTGTVFEQNGTYYVEAYVREARGGDETFRRYNYDGFVMLSRKDAEKWDFEEGDVVVVIGGQSRNSRILDLTGNEKIAETVEAALWHKGRNAALEVLELFEYDVGESGHNGPQREKTQSEPSEAAQIKREIDTGQREPEYSDVLRVSCRLLELSGWDEAWQWLEETFGEDFTPEKTREKLTTLVEYYFDDIEPPSRN
jgi:hypothetical protein